MGWSWAFWAVHATLVGAWPTPELTGDGLGLPYCDNLSVLVSSVWGARKLRQTFASASRTAGLYGAGSRGCGRLGTEKETALDAQGQLGGPLFWDFSACGDRSLPRSKSARAGCAGHTEGRTNQASVGKVFASSSGPSRASVGGSRFAPSMKSSPQALASRALPSGLVLRRRGERGWQVERATEVPFHRKL